MSDDELRGRTAEGYNVYNRLMVEVEFCEQDRHHTAKAIMQDIAKRLMERIKLYETVLEARVKAKGGENNESIHHTDSSGPEQDREGGHGEQEGGT